MRAFRQQQQSLPTTQSYPAANTYNYGANYQTPYTMNQTQQSSYYGNGGAGAGVGGGYQPPQGPPPPKEAYRGGSAGEYLHNDVNNVNGGAGSSMPPPPSYVDVSQPNAQGESRNPPSPSFSLQSKIVGIADFLDRRLRSSPLVALNRTRSVRSTFGTSA